MSKERFTHRISGGADEPQAPEDGRFRLSSLREMNLDDPVETGTFVRFLNHPTNREHFTNPPTTVEELRSMFSPDTSHPLIARNMQGEIVGGAVIFDAQPFEHDHYLRFVVIDSEMQNRGLGRQMLTQVIDWAFATSASDGRERLKLDVNVIEGIRGWEKMENILEKLDFGFIHRLPQEVDVYSQELGVMVTRATHRWELMRNKWMSRGRFSSTNPQTN